MCYCGIDYCKTCNSFKKCGGCKACDGRPNNGPCVAAEYVKKYGLKNFNNVFKKELINEINSLNIVDLHIEDLNLISGCYVNLEYPIDGKKIKLLNDSDIYLGNQIKIPNSDFCYGIVCNQDFILIAKYGNNGSNPSLIVYKSIQK